MPKPALIRNPKKVAIYLPEITHTRARALAAESGISLSQLVASLLDTQADTLCKIRIHADFPADEYEQIKEEAMRQGMTIEDLVRTATYHLLDTK